MAYEYIFRYGPAGNLSVRTYSQKEACQAIEELVQSSSHRIPHIFQVFKLVPMTVVSEVRTVVEIK